MSYSIISGPGIDTSEYADCERADCKFRLMYGQVFCPAVALVIARGGFDPLAYYPDIARLTVASHDDFLALQEQTDARLGCQPTLPNGCPKVVIE